MSEEKELPPICREKQFAMVLSHAVQMYEHIMDETQGDQDTLDSAHVTLGADFVVDCFDLLLEYALRYEGDDFEGIHDQLIIMYEEQAKRRSGFGGKTIH